MLNAQRTKLVEIIDGITDEATKISILRTLTNTFSMAVMRACVRHADEQAREAEYMEEQRALGRPDADIRAELDDARKEKAMKREEQGFEPIKPALEIAEENAHLYLSAADMLMGHKLSEFDRPMAIDMVFDFSTQSMAGSGNAASLGAAQALGIEDEVKEAITHANARKAEELKVHRDTAISLFNRIVANIDEPSWTSLDNMRIDALINLNTKIADSLIKDRCRLVINTANFLHLFAGEIAIKMDVAHQFMQEANRLITENKAAILQLATSGAQIRTLTTLYSVMADRRTNTVQNFNCQKVYDDYVTRQQATALKAA